LSNRQSATALGDLAGGGRRELFCLLQYLANGGFLLIWRIAVPRQEPSDVTAERRAYLLLLVPINRGVPTHDSDELTGDLFEPVIAQLEDVRDT